MTIFYNSQRMATDSQSSQVIKIYLQVISAHGNYLQFCTILSQPGGIGKVLRSNSIQIIQPKKVNKSKPIVIDLRQFLFHHQPNPQDSKYELFVITKFIQQGQRGQNKFISSDNGITQIYFDIRNYYKYKQRKFVQFCLYSYRDYLKQIIQDKDKYGMQIKLKKSQKHTLDGNNNVTSLEYLNDQNTGRRLILQGDPFIQNKQKNRFLFIHHINGPIDMRNLQDNIESIQKELNQLQINNKYPKLWIDWKKDKTGLLIYNNKQKLSNQRSVIKTLLKKILTNIVSGKSIFSTSLPVAIFQNVSLVEKICKCFGYAPLVFQQISNNPYKSDNLKYQIKSILIIMMGLSILYIQQMSKPFNSVIGQTYQGLINGCPIYAEQISHHPPITLFYMKGKGYHIYGSLEPTVNFSMNKIVGSNKGFVSVAFDQENCGRNVMSFTFPNTEMSGLAFGDRTVIRSGVSYLFSEKNKIFGKVNWGPKQQAQKQIKNKQLLSTNADQQRLDYLQGKVYKLNDQISVSKSNYTEIIDENYKKQLLSFNGNWASSLFINDVNQFDFANELPYECIQYPYILPSHSNLRQDIKYKCLNDIQRSEAQKDRIQELQRYDRKLREKYGYFQQSH